MPIPLISQVPVASSNEDSCTMLGDCMEEMVPRARPLDRRYSRGRRTHSPNGRFVRETPFRWNPSRLPGSLWRRVTPRATSGDHPEVADSRMSDCVSCPTKS